MHKKELRGWLKHIDFIVLDVVMLQICFVLSYWMWIGIENPYSTYIYIPPISTDTRLSC